MKYLFLVTLLLSSFSAFSITRPATAEEMAQGPLHTNSYERNGEMYYQIIHRGNDLGWFRAVKVSSRNGLVVKYYHGTHGLASIDNRLIGQTTKSN